MNKLIFVIIYILSFQSLYSQSNFFSLPLHLLIQNDTVNNAFSGGQNFIMAYEIQQIQNFAGFNTNRVLIVYDKSGNHVNFYKKVNGKYFYFNPYLDQASKDIYTSNIFKHVNEWLILKDLNADNLPDLITYRSGSAIWYKNITNVNTNYKLQFDTTAREIFTDYNIGVKVKAYASAIEPPVFYDIDNDGDKDYFNFAAGGTLMEMHKNYQVENNLPSDSLDLKIDDYCWGKFSENFNNNQVALGITCRPQRQLLNARHSGSTILFFDWNDDGKTDILLGDISYTTLNLLINGQVNQNATIINQDTNFPSQDTTVQLSLFPGAYEIDVNDDLLPDLLVSPFAANVSENYNSVWLYQKTQDATNRFQLKTKNFFEKIGFDLGEGATPIWIDMDANPNTPADILIGNYGYYQNTGAYKSQIAYLKFESQGYYRLITRDIFPLDISQRAATPTVADIDNDGLVDVLIGLEDGTILHYEKNNSNPSNLQFTKRSNSFFNIDVGQFAAPFLYDVNKDGLIDLIVGERNGNLNYIQNSGTTTNPQFQVSTMNQNWLNVDVREPGFVTGYSIPCIASINENQNQNEYLFVGTESGTIFQYSLNGNLITKDYLKYDAGIRSAPTFDNDNNLIIGNYRGGIEFVKIQTNTALESQSHQNELNIYPNPSTGKIKFENTSIHDVRVFDLTGKSVHFERNLVQNEIFIQQSGIYIVQVITENKVYSNKIIIKSNPL